MPLNTTYHAPATVAEALELLSQHGVDAKVVAGGQSLLPLINLRLARPEKLIDLRLLAPELSYIRRDGEYMRIGALTRHRDVERSTEVALTLPLLHQGVRLIGHTQIRNRGTIGGSLAHADPAAEYPVALTCLGAEFRLQSSAGERWVPADQFFLAPLVTTLLPEELVTEVRIPVPPAGTAAAFREFSLHAGHLALVSTAVLLRISEGVVAGARIAVGGATPVPQRLPAAEACLTGRAPTEAAALAEAAAETAMAEVCPEDGMNASAEYQRHLTQVLVRAAVTQALWEVEKGWQGVPRS